MDVAFEIDATKEVRFRNRYSPKGIVLRFDRPRMDLRNSLVTPRKQFASWRGRMLECGLFVRV
jgi:hypothetical protein